MNYEDFDWKWAPYEVAVPTLLSALLYLAMLCLPLDLSWWGGSALGCYLMGSFMWGSLWVQGFCAWCATGAPVWCPPLPGLAELLAIFGGVAAYMTVVGPLGQALFTAPQKLGRRVRGALR